MSERQAFARQTKHGIVSCPDFDECVNSDSPCCTICKRNTYSTNKERDFFIAPTEEDDYIGDDAELAARARALARAHWRWLARTLEALYVDAMVHGFVHGFNDAAGVVNAEILEHKGAETQGKGSES